MQVHTPPHRPRWPGLAGLALVAAALGCDGGAAEREAELAARRAAAQEAKAAEATPREPAQPTPPVTPPPQKKPLAELFPPGAVDLPTPLLGARFGMTEEEARAAVPALAEGTTLTPAAFDGVTIAVQYFSRSRTLRLVQVALPVDAAASTLESRWGPPLSRGGADAARCWVNAETGVQASLDGEGKLLLRAFLPWRSILGVPDEELGDAPAGDAPAPAAGKKGKGKVDADAYPALGVEPEPLLGMTLDAVKREYAAALRDSAVVTDARVVLTVPPHECTARPTFVDLSVTEGVVDRIHLTLEHGGDAATRDAIEAAITAKYGEAVARKDAVSTHVAGRVKAIVSRDEAAGTFSLFLSPAK
ncbi:MAG: hypothetical protein H6713_14950 [Myxococcales bacterium]|nr:hypothetical protein [Myxococcales bacterium]